MLKYIKIGAGITLGVLVVLALVAGAFGALPNISVFADAPEAPRLEAPAFAAQTGCYSTASVVALMNEKHAVDENDARPVLDLLDAEASKIAVNAGNTVARSTNGFVLFWTREDIDPTSFTVNEAGGKAEAYFGGGYGTVLGFYDSAVVVPVAGYYLDNVCERINPTAQLTWWPGYSAPNLSTPIPQINIPAPSAQTGCVDPDALIAKLNQFHTVDENDVTPITSWLDSLGVGTAVHSGDSVHAWKDSTIMWTTADIEPRKFTKTSAGGTLVALFGGGRGTIFAMYDGDWIMPVDGVVAPMCGRVNPSADLDYWWKP